MRRLLLVCFFLLLVGPVDGAGLLIPTEKKLPPLALLNHQVNVAIDEQVAITKIEQTFRNHTDRQLEATYVFPVPKGASVRKFTMTVNGKEEAGELVEADKARKIYTDIVRQTQDPGLLEYLGNNLIRMRVFPILPKSDQKVSISYTSIADSDNGLIEYVYPLKADSKAVSTLEKFSVNVTLRSQHAVHNIYSPTHGITVSRTTDKQASIAFEKDQALLDRDFQLFYTLANKDVGLNALAHRPNSGQNGHFMLLMSPRAELSKEQQVPRDMIFVLDTSGSMRGKRMSQARNALQYCLRNLNEKDRFALLNFATTVNRYNDQLQPATSSNVDAAKRWVDQLEATGGTAINDALAAALAMRSSDISRTFTVVFFTDGRPTIGETNTDKIIANVQKNNSSNTRLFTFGVGDDVNAAMLDKLSEDSRALATYVRESEDIESKVSGLFAKISHPVLANLKLTVGPGVSLNEIYPTQLPDLFHGSQLVVLGRYSGAGHAAVTLTGAVGMDKKEFVYEVNFPEKTSEDKSFVEDLWARRKVGFLLDQIRINGEKKELVDEVVTLAKRYGITTPYTSWLIVPDAPIPVAGPRPLPRPGMPDVRFNLGAPPPALKGAGASAAPGKVEDFARLAQKQSGGGGQSRGEWAEKSFADAKDGAGSGDKALAEAKNRYENLRAFQQNAMQGYYRANQEGRLGVEISLDANQLRNQSQVTQNAQRRLGDRNVLEIGGVWIDESFDATLKTVTVKAMSDAYFRILERHPQVKDVFRIANHLVWVTPSKTALIIDCNHGAESLDDAAIDALFVAAKK